MYKKHLNIEAIDEITKNLLGRVTINTSLYYTGRLNSNFKPKLIDLTIDKWLINIIQTYL